MRLGNPFNIKLIIFLGIVVLAVSLVFAFAFPPIYASDAGCGDHDPAWSPHWTLLCYVKQLYDQNQQIIEKLDWQNCMLYNAFDYNRDTRAVVICGEIP